MFYDDIRPQYYLRRWEYYEEAKEELNCHELESAKVFFHGLKQLPQSDLKLLSEVYYKAERCTVDRQNGFLSSVKPIKDAKMAVTYHVSIDKFKAMRLQAQDRLKAAMQKILQEIQSSCVYRINRSLYLVDMLDRGTSKEKYVLGKECDAKKFNASDSESEARDLKALGFERVPVNEKKEKLLQM